MIYTLEALRQEYQKGNRYKYLFFWGPPPPADGGVNQRPQPVVDAKL